MKTEAEVHFTGKVAQKAIIRKGNTVLLTRDINDEDTWELPGGRLNHDELPAHGLAREIFEELGVDVVVGPIMHAQQFYHARDQEYALLLVYEAKLSDEQQPFTFGPNEVAEIRWVTAQELDHQHIFDDMRKALDVYFSQS